ncbi:MAG: Maf family protein, partial [Firmicutes bacterium]|nr:Maf family protein [Bacillota bacterium]
MNINDLPVILASGSPRRIEMLKADGLDPFVLKPDCDETLHTPLAPHQTVMALA